MHQKARLIALAFFIAAIARPASAAPSTDASPSAAIKIVLDTQADKIRAVDRPSDWWHDTKERTWSVKRPVEPGIVDSTHTFAVTYKIDGVTVATWRVDTSNGTAVAVR